MTTAKVSFPRNELAAFCEKWKIRELSLFGSVLRDDFRPDSDVDILARFDPTSSWSLIDLVRMQDELEQMLGRKVDLVERKAVEQSENYIRRNHILQSAEPIYVAR